MLGESQSIRILKDWLLSEEHFTHPYPTTSEQAKLMASTGVSKKQLKNWFTNARRRIWKPLIRKELDAVRSATAKGLPTNQERATRIVKAATAAGLSVDPGLAPPKGSSSRGSSGARGGGGGGGGARGRGSTTAATATAPASAGRRGKRDGCLGSPNLGVPSAAPGYRSTPGGCGGGSGDYGDFRLHSVQSAQSFTKGMPRAPSVGQLGGRMRKTASMVFLESVLQDAASEASLGRAQGLRPLPLSRGDSLGSEPGSAGGGLRRLTREASGVSLGSFDRVGGGGGGGLLRTASSSSMGGAGMPIDDGDDNRDEDDDRVGGCDYGDPQSAGHKRRRDSGISGASDGESGFSPPRSRPPQGGGQAGDAYYGPDRFRPPVSAASVGGLDLAASEGGDGDGGGGGADGRPPGAPPPPEKPFVEGLMRRATSTELLRRVASHEKLKPTLYARHGAAEAQAVALPGGGGALRRRSSLEVLQKAAEMASGDPVAEFGGALPSSLSASSAASLGRQATVHASMLFESPEALPPRRPLPQVPSIQRPLAMPSAEPSAEPSVEPSAEQSSGLAGLASSAASAAPAVTSSSSFLPPPWSSSSSSMPSDWPPFYSGGGDGGDDGEDLDEVDNPMNTAVVAPRSAKCAFCTEGGVDTQLRPCGHLFHSVCLKPWLQAADGPPVCLSCKSPISSCVLVILESATQAGFPASAAAFAQPPGPPPGPPPPRRALALSPSGSSMLQQAGAPTAAAPLSPRQATQATHAAATTGEGAPPSAGGGARQNSLSEPLDGADPTEAPPGVSAARVRAAAAAAAVRGHELDGGGAAGGAGGSGGGEEEDDEDDGLAPTMDDDGDDDSGLKLM